MMQDRDAISLFQLNTRIKNSLRNEFSDLIWVVAEINQISEHSSGHCYLELVEKDEKSDKIKAGIRANIWASTYHRLAAFFKSTTGQDLSSGMKVLVRVQVDFHELYSISLNIRDIDPAYTLGDMARRRAEILTRLEEAGVIDMNRELSLPTVIQKIAVISSLSAAGYEDFIDQLNNNSGNYRFYPKLFPARMQGDQTTGSILSALDRIEPYSDFFDAVVIIRGGGSKTDLSYFDDYDLAYYITQFPIPVITGIGHERDESVADLVAHTSCKTPTAVAAFLIDLAEQFDAELSWYKEQISQQSRKILSTYDGNLIRMAKSLSPLLRHYRDHRNFHLQNSGRKAESYAKRFIQMKKEPLYDLKSTAKGKTKNFLLHNNNRQNNLFESIRYQIKSSLSAESYRLDLFTKECNHSDPVIILRKGYSITYLNGVPLKDPSQVKKGDQITTRVNKGNIDSTVI